MAQREYPLRMVAWELTRNCNLNCIHCRAAATLGPHTDELTTDQCRAIIDDISGFASPTVIITGGEPLMRDDIFDIIEYGNNKGLRLVMAINGTLLNAAKAEALRENGIKRVSLSLDGKDNISHDSFRGVDGSYNSVIEASQTLMNAELPFQINTTVTRLNIGEIQQIYDVVKSIGACAWHIFLLVPVGRGGALKGKELDADMYEKTLEWLYGIEKTNEIEVKVTCAPHYYRIVKERGGLPKSAGCLAGKSFMFISHRGVAQPCGYLEVPSGNVVHEGVKNVWTNSAVFRQLRDNSHYKGKCGKCKYLDICGGCRARAYELYGDMLAEEPLCTYKA